MAGMGCNRVRVKKQGALREWTPSHDFKPYFQERLYISSVQISKLIVKLTFFMCSVWQNHMNIMTNLYHVTFASLHKSIWTWGQIWIKLVTNTNRDYSKSTGISWQLWMPLLIKKKNMKMTANLHIYSDKSEWYRWQIHMKMIANAQELVFICYTIDM